MVLEVIPRAGCRPDHRGNRVTIQVLHWLGSMVGRSGAHQIGQIPANLFSLIAVFIIIPPKFYKSTFMTACPSFKSPGRISSGTTLVIPKITAFTALLLIALVCITIPVGAIDTQNSTANSTGVPAGNLSVDETPGNSTPAMSVTYEPTATPTIESLASLDNKTAMVQESILGNENPEHSPASTVVTTTPLTTSTLLAEDPIKAMSTVARPGISETEPAIHPPGAAPAALFVGTPVSGIGPQAGYWTFEILDDIYANSRVTINGDSDPAHY